MSDDYFEQKVIAATQSVARARTVFLISNIAAIIIVAANFNLYFSWLRNMIVRPVDPAYQEVLKAIARARIEDTAIISVPLVGMKFFAADIGILSAVSMLVLSIWMYYSFRREQHTVGRIVLEVKDGPETGDLESWRVAPQRLARAQYLLYALSAAFLFTTSSRSRLAIGDPKRVDEKPDPELRSARWMTAVLIWAPCWTIVLSLALDIASMFFPSSLLSGPPLQSVLARKHELEAYIRFGATGLLALLVGWIVLNVNYHHIWTSKVYVALAQMVRLAETNSILSPSSSSAGPCDAVAQVVSTPNPELPAGAG
jgi:hypothetical protein